MMLVMLWIIGVLHDRLVLSVLVEDVSHGSLLDATASIHDGHAKLAMRFALTEARCLRCRSLAAVLIRSFLATSSGDSPTKSVECPRGCPLARWSTGGPYTFNCWTGSSSWFGNEVTLMPGTLKAGPPDCRGRICLALAFVAASRGL